MDLRKNAGKAGTAALKALAKNSDDLTESIRTVKAYNQMQTSTAVSGKELIKKR